MAEKKSYKGYQDDPFVKAPALAWLMDRPKAMLPVLGVGVVSIGLMLGSGWQSYANISAPPENTSPYQNVEAASFDAKTWAIELVEEQPPNADSWEVSENYRGRPILEVENYGNTADKLPESLLMTASATGSGIETRVQVYGAGQAGKHFDAMQSDIAEDTNYEPSVESVSQSRILRFSEGFLVNTGDAIVSVLVDDVSLLDELESFYLPTIESTIASTCASIHPRSNDYTRSFFYDNDEYTGLLERETLVTEVNFEGLPTPSNLELLQVGNPNAIAPEAPLPESFDDIPDERDRPGLEQRPETRESFEKVAEYQVEDVNGPGCGWDWTAHAQPVHDLDQLEQEQQETLESTQDAVNTSAREYISTQRNWALMMAGNMPVINDWNKHVNNINSIHEDWEQLRAARQDIRTDWYNYVEAHDTWSQFPELQRDAQESYSDELQICRDAREELEEWEDEYGNAEAEQREARQDHEEDVEAWEERQAEREREAAESAAPSPSPAPSNSDDENEDGEESPSPTPSPTPTETPSPSAVPTPSSDPSPTFELEDIPERPDGCDSPPERPSILDQERGDEPSAPEIPEDVTVPNSWPQPENTPSGTEDIPDEG